MNLKTFLLLLIFAFSFMTVRAQYQFQKKHIFSNIVNEYNAVVQTSDSGYAVAGSPGATNNDDDLKLARLNKFGDTLWTRTYGSPTVGNQESCWAKSIVQANDDGFFIAGYTEGFGSSDFNYFLVRTNSVGDTLWTRTLSYPNSGHDYAYSCLQTSDGNFVAFGRQGVFNVDFYLSKWNNAGALLWAKAYDLSSSHDFGNSVFETSDGGFIMGGYSTPNGLFPDILVIKTDSTGAVQWARKIWPSPGVECNSVIQSSDGGYILTGITNYDLFVVKLDSSGNLMWTKIYGSTGFENGMKILEVPGGGYIITGDAYNSTFSQGQMCLIRIDVSGNILWANNYGPSAFGTEGIDVALTYDGGFVACGHIFDSPRGAYIVKTDSLGNSGCNQTPLTLNVSAGSFVINNYSPTVSSNSQVISPPSIVGSGANETIYCSYTGLGDESLGFFNFNIFPNPATDDLNIQYSSNEKGILNIYSLHGTLVHTEQILAGDSKVDISNFESGLYIAEIQTRLGSKIKKFAVVNN